MNILVVIGSTQNHAFIGSGEICPTLTSAMGMGGGHIPMLVFEESDGYIKLIKIY